jgi:hypothetical protein
VDDGLLGALERFEGAADEVLAGLGENFDGHVIGNVAAFDEPRTKSNSVSEAEGKATRSV